VDGQADDAGGRLGEQQHQAGGHAGTQRAVLVGEQLAEQLQPAVLGDRPGPADRQRRQRKPGEVASAHRPAQERQAGGHVQPGRARGEPLVLHRS
jgi:hypothetical protein